MSLPGFPLLDFPLMRYINVNDAEAVIRAIHLTDDDMSVDLVLHTPHGLVLACRPIARAIKAHKGRVTALVPMYRSHGNVSAGRPAPSGQAGTVGGNPAVSDRYGA